jgi:hypothetical protein
LLYQFTILSVERYIKSPTSTRDMREAMLIKIGNSLHLADFMSLT